MSRDKRRSDLIRTIHVDDSRVGEILERLDCVPCKDAAEQRSAQRFGYRIQACVIHLKQPGDTGATPYLVPTRDISSHGLAFLHGGFIHVGAVCMAQLISTHGVWKSIKGKIVRCRHVEGNIHDVGVRFDDEIEPSVFSAHAPCLRILVVEDDPDQARLVTFHLQALHAKVELAEDGRAAVESALQNPYDAVFMDMDLPVQDGFAVTTELRRREYTGVIVALTGLTRPEDHERCLKAGCDHYIPKPFTRAELIGLLNSLRNEPLISTFQGDKAVADLIDKFVQGLPSQIQAMKQALADSDNARLETFVRAVRAEGGAYGFEPIMAAATQLESALLEHAPSSVVQHDLDAVEKLCGLAQPVNERPRTEGENEQPAAGGGAPQRAPA